jgi:hypothetical protein
MVKIDQRESEFEGKRVKVDRELKAKVWYPCDYAGPHAPYLLTDNGIYLISYNNNIVRIGSNFKTWLLGNAKKSIEYTVDKTYNVGQVEFSVCCSYFRSTSNK